mgnify:FL=1
MSSTLNNTTRITNERRIAFGPQDQLMNMSRTKYKWATEIYDRMEANTWFPKSIPLVADRETYRSGALNARERNAYDKALAFVSNLDGIQFNNLIHNIGQHITAPEVSLAIARQASEEGVHVRSYQFLSQVLTPFYQSDSRLLPALRDHLIAPITTLPGVRSIISTLVTGDLLDPRVGRPGG